MANWWDNDPTVTDAADSGNWWANDPPAPAAATPAQPASARRDGVAEIGAGLDRVAELGRQTREAVKAVPSGAIGMGGVGLRGGAGLVAGGQQSAAQFGRGQIETMDRIDRGETVSEMDDAMGYQQMDSGQRAAARAQAESARDAFNPGKVEDSPLYRAGEAVTEFGDKLIPPAPGYEDSTGRMIGQGLGSVVAGIAASVVTGPAGAGALFALTGAGEAVDRAIAEGATEDEILQSAKLGIIPGMTDSIPIEVLLGRIPLPGVGRIQVPPGMLGAAMRVMGRMGTQAFVEALQEGGQEFLQNVIAQNVYNPEQELFDGVPEGAGIGAAVGAITEALFTPFRRRGGSTAPAPESETTTPATPPAQQAGQAIPPPVVDRERVASPRLTQAERDGPYQNDILDDGKDIIEKVMRGEAPVSDTMARSDTPASQIAPETQGRIEAEPEQREGWEPLYNDNNEQIGWNNPTTGQMRRLSQGLPPVAAEPVAATTAPEAAAPPPVVAPAPVMTPAKAESDGAPVSATTTEGLPEGYRVDTQGNSLVLVGPDGIMVGAEAISTEGMQTLTNVARNRATRGEDRPAPKTETPAAAPELKSSPSAPPSAPRVFVNKVGRDGKTDAERGGPLAPQAAPERTIEPFTAKSVIVRGVSQAEGPALFADMKGKPLWNAKAEGWVFSKKREAEAREAIAAPATAPVAERSDAQSTGYDLKPNGDGQFMVTARAGDGSHIGQMGMTVMEVDGKRYLSIDDVMVRDGHQGKGVGTGLYQHVLDTLPAGIDGLLSETSWIKNKQQVPRIHEKLKETYDATNIEQGVVFSPRKGSASAAPTTKAAEPDAKGRRALGANADGQTVFEDQNGVRSVSTDGIRRTEPVALRPDGGRSVPDNAGRLAQGRDAFLTRDELAALTAGRDPSQAEAKQDATPAKAAEPKAEAKPEPKYLVSDARRDELRKRLKAKLKGQLNAGIDPEIIAIGTELTVATIERGVRKFMDVSAALASDLEMSLAELRPYLRSWYNGARDMMEDGGVSVEGMDDAQNVRDALADIDALIARQAQAETTPQSRDTVTPPAEEASDAGRRNQAGATDGGLRSGTRDVPSREPSEGTRPNEGDGQAESALPGDRRGSRRDVAVDRGADADQPASAGRDEGADGVLPVDSPRRGRTRDGGSGQRSAVKTKAEKEVSDDRASRARRNYRITEADEIGKGGPKAKVRANIAAIRTLKQIEEEGRAATADEKKILVKYTGWGAFAQPIFDRAKRPEWAEERAAVFDLLTPEEVASARKSTLNAHYTSPEVIEGMWQALDHLGFKGGRALEPSAGVGHFIGLTPKKVLNDTAWSAVELDTTTGRIAALLYDGSDVNVMGFEQFNRPDGFFDLAISNVPFGDFTIRDTKRPGYLIHDYFFIKALDMVRPGGMVAFITSDGTMDKIDTKARDAMLARADFVGAIRLPGGDKGAFAGNAGTQVTTDIIFLRPRAKGTPAQHIGNFRDLKTVQTPEGPAQINAYFAANPDMMLGEMRKIGTMYRADQKVLIGDVTDLDKKIAAAAKKMPKNAILPRGPQVERIAKQSAKIDAEASGTVKEGAFYLKGGKPYRKVNGVGQPTKLTAADAKKLPDFIVMRDIVNDLLRGQATGQKDANAQLRKNLNAAYDKFVKAHGPINQVVETVQQRTDRKTGETRSITIRKYPNFTPFAEDPDAFKTAAIESYDEATGKASKAAIFKEDIVGSYTPPEITGPTDAIAVSLNQTGKIDMPAIATQLNISEAQAIEAMGDLIYLDPAGDQWRTANEYLSGDVVTRLEEARAAAKTEPGKYARNVEALQAVQPTPLTRIDIRLQFGAPWIPADVYESFLTSIGGRGVKVRMNPMTKAVQVSDGVFDQSAQTRFGTDRAGVMEIANAALKQTTFKVYDKDANGDAVVNEKATQEVLQKINAIREEFIGIQDAGVEGWAFSDEARGDRLEALYNAALNRLVPTVYDGSHLALPGLAKTIIGRDGDPVAFDLRPHQKDAVWRVIQSGNALLDHVVGAGKTFTMIAAGMEQKRLGLIQRPMYAVPNHMLEQFSREFYQAYPNAKLLIATKDQMTKARRKEFAARVAADKWDGIIITHDAFGRIRMSDQAVADYLNTEVDRLQVAADAAREEEGAKSRTVKEIEKAKEKLETRIRDLMNVERKDEGVTFEELGVDYIVVDEAHLFKNLRTPTRHTRVKGIGKTASQRAEDLFMKIQTLEKNRPGRSVLFATGTPISNTMAEMYTMQRYLQNDTLREYGIDEFDAWAATFGSIETAMELSPNGRTMQEVTSFRSFINIPELVGLYSRVADVKTAEMLNLPRPTLKGGGIKVVEAEPSDAEEAYIASLVERADFLKKNPQPPTKGADNMLKIVSEGRKVAIDFRLIEPGAAMNPEGKVAKLVSNVARIHKEGKHPALAQLIFLDMGVPQKAGQSQAVVPARDDDAVDTVMDDETSEAVAVEDSEIYKTKFDLYNDIRDKLVADGIPRKEIAFIHEATDDVKKAALFRKVRSGEVRVLLGSTGKMGVGTNVQKLLYAMHHVDAPWKPAEVEQRDGRIIRQGNENAEVEMYRYITKRSFDSFMWQALERKSKFIGQIKAGARGIRSAEDIDDPLPEAATLKAAASGDPRIMEHAELTKEVRDLDNLARNHDRDIQRAKGNLNNTREELKRIEAQKSKLDADKKAVKDVSGDKFTVNLAFAPGRGPVTDRKTAGELVRKFLLDSGGNLWGSSPTTWTVGEIGGLTMKVEAQRRSDGIAVQPFVEGEGRYLSGQFILAEDGDPIGLMSRFERPLRDIPVMAERMPANIAAKKEEITRLEKQAEPKPFAREARRVEAKRRLIELEAALRPKDPAQDVRADGGETLMAARREDAAQGEAQSGDATIREESGRFAFDLTTSARFQQKRDAVFAELRKQLDGFGLPDVALRVSDRIGLFIDGIADGDLDGVFWKGIVEVALDARNATTTVRHEAVHAMKRMGLFTNSEWKILTDRAKREWMKTYRIASPDRYGAWTEAQQFEEAIAAAFENWKGGEPASGMIARLFQRMRDFIEALGNALRGNGFNTVEIIFADMEAGNVGRRGLEAANDADAPMAARKQKDDDTAGSFGRPRESIVQSLTNDNRSFLSNVHKATSWAAASESIDRWRYKFQDDVIDLRNVQREIEQMRGSQLKEADNAYLAYELYESRTGPRLEKLHEEIVAPLVHGIYERLDGKELSVTFEDGSSETVTGSDMLDLYRYALHAPERNARIAEINEEMPDGGSGMTDGDAEAVIDAVREAGLEPDLKALAKMAKRLTDFSRDVRVEAGLLSQEQADAWDRAYDNYVPLRGFAEMDPEIVTDRPNFGSGVNVRGPESKKARGRSSRAGDLLAFSIMQAQEALVRAGRNEVGVSLYNLAKANPNKEFWKVNKTRVKAYWNEDAQKVEYRADKTLNPTDDRLTVTAKIDGKEYRVTFNASNPTAVRIGEALRKQAGSEKLVRAIVGTLGQVNRYLSMVNTSINPEFVITNAIRDAQTAGINLQARGDGIAKAAAKHYFPALKAATKGAFGKGSGEWGGWYERFRMEGGQTHWNRVDDIPTIRKRLQRELNDIRNPLTARRAVNGIFNTIQNLNSGVENAARLASFRAAVEAGMTEAQAASIAKNVTVNFNRRGVYGPAANAMYLFFNASVQGSFTILSAMRAPKVRKIVGGIVAFGALNAVLNNLLGDDDEDGQSFYDKLPQYTKERNIILMLPGQGGKHLAFPMPYGYSAFHTMGRAAAEVAFGRSPLDAAGDIAAAIEGSFNPIGGSESILNFLAPTIVDPFIDLVTNRDFRGQPIKPEQPAFGPSVPESQLYWNSVSPISKTVAETLNELTGGDSVRPGAIDISPNALQYIYGVVTGAAGQTVRRAAELPMKFLDPESEIELNDIVFVRRAIGDKPGWVDKSMFYDRTNEIRQVESYLKRYQEQGLSAKARDLRQENISILRLSGLADDSRKTLSETRRERATLYRMRDEGRITAPAFKARIERLKERDDAAVLRFNKAWISSGRRE